MQSSIAYFDNYEVFDCRLFHNSIDANKFSTEELKNKNIDQSTLDDF